jgi:hypothetical protein
MVNRQSCSQWWQQDHTNAQPCMCIKTTLMHLKKNIKAPFGIRRGFFFLFPVFSLRNFYTIPVKFLCSKGALSIEWSSMLKILNLCKTYDLWTCTQTKITVLDIYTALKMNNTRWLCLCLRKKHLVNVNVQLGGCTEKTSGKCKPKGCSIELSRAAIVICEPLSSASTLREWQNSKIFYCRNPFHLVQQKDALRCLEVEARGEI